MLELALSVNARPIWQSPDPDTRNPRSLVACRGKRLGTASRATAGVMLMGSSLDQRLVSAYRRQTEMFRRGAELLRLAPELLEIPFEGATLPGYFFRVSELDGPGQGAALIRQGLTLRSDWENVITPVLNFALSRPDVDPDRVAVIGLSLGALQNPRPPRCPARPAPGQRGGWLPGLRRRRVRTQGHKSPPDGWVAAVGDQMSSRKRRARPISNVTASLAAPSRAISRGSEMDLTSSHFA